jgi:hypothetical protein
MRAAAVVGLVAVALIHFLDLFSKLSETPYLGVAYLILIAGCLAAAALLLHGPTQPAWALVAVVAGAPFLAYCLSRSVGLPAATDDIGNWQEPLGLASLFVEGLLVLLATAVATRGGSRRPGARSHEDSSSALPLGA